MELRTLGLGRFDLYVDASPLQRLPYQIRMRHRAERGFMTSHQSDGLAEPRRWHFRRMGKAEMNDDPIQGEFFTNQDIADRLVRETLQNSLDAAIGSDQVVVRFALRNSRPSDSVGLWAVLQSFAAALGANP